MAVSPRHLTGDKAGTQQFLDQFDVSPFHDPDCNPINIKSGIRYFSLTAMVRTNFAMLIDIMSPLI